MDLLLNPPKESVVYEDAKVLVCLASFPLTRGHVVVVWKEAAPDLHLLERRDYEYLMDTVDAARDALLDALGVEKVYLIYMDEAKQVHWHLVPRYDEKGFNVLAHEPKETRDFSLAPSVREAFARRVPQM